MPSMSYCMFENTVEEMKQCLDAVENVNYVEDLDLNEYEKRSLPRLYDLCKRFTEEFERITENEESTIDE